MAPVFPVNIEKLESHLLTRSYVEGYTPSQADVIVFSEIPSEPAESYPNVSRWYNHIKSYTAEFDSLPGSSTAGKAFIRSAETKEEEEKEKKEDDDAFNLFESDDEDDEEAARIRAETLAAYHAKKAAKPKVAAKSIVTIDIKPWDDTADLLALEKKIRTIEKQGLVWGQSKIIDIGFGAQKLQIGCVVEDDIVSIDTLQEEIEALDEDNIQSTDIANMQKL